MFFLKFRNFSNMTNKLKDAKFQNLSKVLSHSPLKNPKTQKPKKFWPVQNFTSQNQPLVKNSGQNFKSSLFVAGV